MSYACVTRTLALVKAHAPFAEMIAVRGNSKSSPWREILQYILETPTFAPEGDGRVSSPSLKRLPRFSVAFAGSVRSSGQLSVP